jgi:gamma-glutamyl-gamma-aminobutyrate hydrolase PuuD
MSPPIVGISTYSVYADWGVWRDLASLTPRTYIDCVARAGGLPVQLPNAEIGLQHIDALLDRLDAVVLVGGEDMCGGWSGREEDPEQHAAHCELRDRFEVELARRAWQRDLPILGICRGAQALNVSRGGTLVEDLPTAGASSEHLIERGVFNSHEVRFERGTRIEVLYGTSAHVPSHHHQAIDRVGEGLRVTGRARDGVIEAVEGSDQRFALGVQWHPEEDEDIVLFDALVQAPGVAA